MAPSRARGYLPDMIHHLRHAGFLATIFGGLLATFVGCGVAIYVAMRSRRA